MGERCQYLQIYALQWCNKSDSIIYKMALSLPKIFNRDLTFKIWLFQKKVVPLQCD